MQIQHSNKSSKHLIFTKALFLAFTLLMFLTPLEVYAGSESTEVEAEHSDGEYSSSGGKWYATYSKSSGYKGQGVLLYLLEKDGGGAVAGTTPKAYACGAQVIGYELHAQDKYNRYGEVTSWESTAPPWQAGGVPNNGGFMRGSLYSNAPAIKAWLKTPSTNTSGEPSTNGIKMVKSIWGPAIAERFTKEEIILVAEPIVAIQFSQYYKNTLLSGLSRFMPIDEMVSSLQRFKEYVPTLGDTAISPDLQVLLDSSISILTTIRGSGSIPSVIREAVSDCYDAFDDLTIGTNIYYPLGDPYAGTPKKLIEYYNSLETTKDKEDPNMAHFWESHQLRKSEAGRSYYRKSASAATYINSLSVVCRNANFNLWPVNQAVRRMHDDAAISSYSIGMLAMCAWTDDEGGDLDIYKVYQDKNGTHKETHHTKGTSPYPVSDEPNYKLIEWKTSTVAPATDPPTSTPWSTLISGKPTVQSGTTPTTITTGDTEKAIYILYKEDDTPTVVDGDWVLGESQLSRHVTTGSQTSLTSLSFTCGSLQK